MKKLTLALAAAASVWTGSAAAQTTPVANTALRQQIERRFEVLVLTDRLVLRPRSATGGVTSIEIGDATIAINGATATIVEVRDKLGADAEAVLRLSILDAAQRRALFAPAGVPEAPAAAPPLIPPPPPDPSVAPIAPPPLPDQRVRRQRRRGERVRIGGGVTVDEDELVTGDVVAIGGSARINGEVRGEVVAVGGSVHLGPRAVVARDIVVVGGSLNRADGALIQGEVHEITIGNLDFGDWGWRMRPPSLFPFGRTFSLMSTLGRVGILCVLAVLVMLLGREYAERTSARAATEPLKAGAIGFLAQLLFLPVLALTVLILIITIIGIPLLLLLPFALLALAILALLGFTSIASHVGQLVSTRFGWSLTSPYAVTILGILVIVSPVLLARLLGLVGGPLNPMAFALGVIGFLVEYVAWTIGFGAVALARLNRPRPPVPPMAMPPPVMP
jgi:hypothetical protein